MVISTLVERLRAEGYKLTPQRLAIIEALASDVTHPTAYEIYDRVRALYPMMGLATVYKTLELLKSLGEVVETGSGTGGARYEPNLHPHVNLVCRSCNRVHDLHLDDPSLAALSNKAAHRLGFQVQGGHIEYFGVCATCRAQESE